jgi:hypothetical protein
MGNFQSVQAVLAYENPDQLSYKTFVGTAKNNLLLYMYT